MFTTLWSEAHGEAGVRTGVDVGGHGLWTFERVSDFAFRILDLAPAVLGAEAVVRLGWFVVGQGTRASSIGEHFRASGREIHAGHILGWAMVLLVAAVVVWGVSRAVAIREGRGSHSPRRLFAELCRVHGLDAPSCRLLRQLARSHRLDHPALVFVRPALFDQLDATLQPSSDQVRQLKDRVFGPALEARPLAD
ncbi:MAG: hypothetical protein FJ276_23160 [Planctomycetes bacterium]|nr:hypothetical protein [Planctomycetota bacterium]